MNLIFNEYIDFLKNKGVGVDEHKLKEGYYWLDRSIIKAYDKEGKIHKILRIYIDEDLNITTKRYEKIPKEIETWQETIERNKDKLIELEQESLSLIKESILEHKEKTPIILTSGGKDSQLVSHLVRQANTNAHAIFNNTSLDCADTYKFIKQDGNLTILSPDEGFYQWRDRNNFVPTRFARACCGIFKEGETVKQLDKDGKYLFFMGMRNQESNHRSSYGDTWKNDKWGDRDWLGILPIKKWSEEEVWLYTLWRNVPINAKYKKGYARVGCAVACPYYTKSTWVLDEFWYPKAYGRWHDILNNDFKDNNKWTIMNCTEKEYHSCWNGGTYREEPTQEIINEFATHNNLDIEVAEKYFNHRCVKCDKRIKSKEDISMNLKYLGRNTKSMYCKKHMKEHLGGLKGEKITNKKWDEIIEGFKTTGCDLF